MGFSAYFDKKLGDFSIFALSGNFPKNLLSLFDEKFKIRKAVYSILC